MITTSFGLSGGNLLEKIIKTYFLTGCLWFYSFTHKINNTNLHICEHVLLQERKCLSNIRRV